MDVMKQHYWHDQRKWISHVLKGQISVIIQKNMKMRYNEIPIKYYVFLKILRLDFVSNELFW